MCEIWRNSFGRFSGHTVMWAGTAIAFCMRPSGEQPAYLREQYPGREEFRGQATGFRREKDGVNDGRDSLLKTARRTTAAKMA